MVKKLTYSHLEITINNDANGEFKMFLMVYTLLMDGIPYLEEVSADSTKAGVATTSIGLAIASLLSGIGLYSISKKRRLILS